MQTLDAKVSVKVIELLWSENEWFQRTNKTAESVKFKSYDEVNRYLRDMSYHGPSLGYDKTDFRVTFEDGETYEGWYDLHRSGTEQENPNGRCDLLDHIRAHVSFYTGDHKPEWMEKDDYERIVGYACPNEERRQEYRIFLEKYL
jgi:hypothetical protein